MKQYLDACRTILEEGYHKENRNGGSIAVHGMMMKFNLQDGFPAVTTKKLNFKAVVAELLGFIRGAHNAKVFRALGTRIWDANAESDYWLANPNCNGDGDLGRIYGVQWRDWLTPVLTRDSGRIGAHSTDQLAIMVDKLINRIDDRRNIVTAWNPGELDQMALPPCHLLSQCHLRGETLDLTMYQRSCDFALGVPFNIASYALLMHILCQIAGLAPGVLTWVGGDCHIYDNQMEQLSLQLGRKPLKLPGLIAINPGLRTLSDFERAVTDDFALIGYEHHPHIAYEFSV